MKLLQYFFFSFFSTQILSQFCENSLSKTCSDECSVSICTDNQCMLRRDNCCDIQCISQQYPTLECPDIDSNGIINVYDVLNILSNFNIDSEYHDLNNNGYVDVVDILATLSSFGQECTIENNYDNSIHNTTVSCQQGEECGGQVWNDCGTSCPLICGNPPVMMCNMMCNAEYQCLSNLWFDNNLQTCVSEEECTEEYSLPPGVSIGRPFFSRKKTITAEIIDDTNNEWI